LRLQLEPVLPRDTTLAVRHGLRSVWRVDKAELARASDVPFVLAPCGDATWHVINADFLRKVKMYAVLVNTWHGTLVDSDALAQARREKWIWGAGLDVVDGEPHIGADHPLVKEPRYVIMPHIGSATPETRLGMVNLAARNALAGIDEGATPAELDVAAVSRRCLGSSGPSCIWYRCRYPHSFRCLNWLRWNLPMVLNIVY